MTSTNRPGGSYETRLRIRREDKNDSISLNNDEAQRELKRFKPINQDFNTPQVYSMQHQLYSPPSEYSALVGSRSISTTSSNNSTTNYQNELSTTNSFSNFNGYNLHNTAVLESEERNSTDRSSIDFFDNDETAFIEAQIESANERSLIDPYLLSSERPASLSYDLNYTIQPSSVPSNQYITSTYSDMTTLLKNSGSSFYIRSRTNDAKNSQNLVLSSFSPTSSSFQSTRYESDVTNEYKNILAPFLTGRVSGINDSVELQSSNYYSNVQPNPPVFPSITEKSSISQSMPPNLFRHYLDLISPSTNSPLPPITNSNTLAPIQQSYQSFSSHSNDELFSNSNFSLPVSYLSLKHFWSKESLTLCGTAQRKRIQPLSFQGEIQEYLTPIGIREEYDTFEGLEEDELEELIEVFNNLGKVKSWWEESRKDWEDGVWNFGFQGRDWIYL